MTAAKFTKGKIDTRHLIASVDIVQVIENAGVALKESGAEFEACCPFHTESSPSFKVSPTKQIYHCFGCGANGDAIKFLQEFSGKSFKEACVALGATDVEVGAGVGAAQPVQRAPVRPKAEPEWVAQPAAPDDAPAPPRAHPYRGLPTHVWPYLSAHGQALGFVYRFTKSDGGKETLPMTWCKNVKTGAAEWRWMGFSERRPLYGLDRLAARPDAPVLVVEGEKCADVGRDLFPKRVVISWSGGGKAVLRADWSALAGRDVTLWADCDAKRVRLSPAQVEAGMVQAEQPLLPEIEQPGVATMLKLGEHLNNIGVRTLEWVPIPAPGERPDGWDVADATRDDAVSMLAAARMFYEIWDGFYPPEDSPVPSDGLEALPVPPMPENLPPAPEGEGEVVQPNAKSRKKEKKPFDFGRWRELMDNFVLIYGTDTCFDQRQRRLIKVNHLRLAMGSDYVKAWLNNDLRQMILPEQLVFDPAMRTQSPEINLFEGFDAKPKKGDVAPILELLMHLCADSAETPEKVEEVALWVLKWLALPLQRPGTKMRSALVFHGPQGAGKNLFFEIVAKIYGRYALVVGQEQLEDKFNDWASQKLFLIGDEVVARAELYHQKNKLKSFITGETIQINTKMMPLRTERNFVNVVFLSNEHQPLALEVGDRRYFVVYTPPRRQDDLYKRVADCLAAGGFDAFHHFLLSMPLDGFSEFDIPPMTTAKRDLIELGLKPAERFVREWIGGHLPIPLWPCSAGQLYKLFKRWATVTGERFFPIQDQFTKSARKTIDLLSSTRGAGTPLLDFRPIKLADAGDNGQKVVRMWIPDGCGPAEGETAGIWAGGAVDAFDKIIAGYTERTGVAP